MRKGFNITEMIIVITIFGILAAVIFTNAAESRKRANDTRRINDLKQVQAALEAYKLTNGSYPSTGDAGDNGFWKGSCTGTVVDASVQCKGVNWVKDLNIGITADLLDPRNTTGLEYTYLYGSDTYNYKLMAWKMQSKQGIAQAQNDGGASSNSAICACSRLDDRGSGPECYNDCDDTYGINVGACPRDDGEDANYELFTQGARCW